MGCSSVQDFWISGFLDFCLGSERSCSGCSPQLNPCCCCPRTENEPCLLWAAGNGEILPALFRQEWQECAFLESPLFFRPSEQTVQDLTAPHSHCTNTRAAVSNTSLPLLSPKKLPEGASSAFRAQGATSRVPSP